MEREELEGIMGPLSISAAGMLICTLFWLDFFGWGRLWLSRLSRERIGWNEMGWDGMGEDGNGNKADRG